MTSHQDNQHVVRVSQTAAQSNIVLICEHASHHIPPEFNDLGLSNDARHSHVAWDPGALAVAETMSQELDAVLIASQVSRLVYDCNRPPHVPDAMPNQSEAYNIPGNYGLTETQRNERIERYYLPFRDAVAAQIERQTNPAVITIHSFTPVYDGTDRPVEIGILHDTDSRLADAMLDTPPQYDIRRNEPYGPEDGVTHTLQEHAIPQGHLNVMLEIRNDLITDPSSQSAMAKTLTQWIIHALQEVEAQPCKD